jgi:hypothetical protein
MRGSHSRLQHAGEETYKATRPVSQAHVCQERPKSDICKNTVLYSSDDVNPAPFSSIENYLSRQKFLRGSEQSHDDCGGSRN